MRAALGKLVLLCALVLEPKPAQGRQQECQTGQFQCRNGRCIPTIWRCDEDDDCSDNSDEESCPKKTCASAEFACKNGQCVPARWRCDGEPECSDGSDEAESTCSRQTCPPEKFDCGGSTSTCVSLSWRCDGEKDCENGADEEECAADGKACGSDEFLCSNLKCIPVLQLCDGDDDCGDRSDETRCAAAACGLHEFRCNSSECVPLLWSCDGDPDCPDRSDEWAERCGRVLEPVARPRCGEGELRCGSGECVRRGWWCDGDADCKDKSDEANCSMLTCQPDEFQCSDGSCIHGTRQCNRVVDCADGSDEAGCINGTKCDGPLKFQCKNGECIDSSKVCDSHRDCKDWSDEPAKVCGLDECEVNNGGCSHICIDHRMGYQCSCPPGYKLLDRKTCGDINECENPASCSQICINYKGDYKCECYEGYEMDPATKTCKAEGSSPYLMFTNRHEIRRIDLLRRDYTQVGPTLKNAIALDVDVAANRMYWCDLFQRKIYSVPIGKSSDQALQVTVIDSALYSPGGLALDWIHKNLYWTDSGDKTISVASVDGKKRRVLIDTHLNEPRAIVVDPRQGFMYWSDWGAQAKIEKAGMNGMDRQVLVSEGIEWPNGITLDLPNGRLYWVDSKLHLISSVDFIGDNRKVLLSSAERLSHPFALTVFEDRLYWSDLEKDAIYSVNRLTGLNVTTLAEHLNNPRDMVVFHQLRQPKVPDSCSGGGVSNGGCEYLCLKAPQISEHSPKYTCACPDGTQLSPDMRRCVAAQPPVKVKMTTTVWFPGATSLASITSALPTTPPPESPGGPGPPVWPQLHSITSVQSTVNGSLLKGNSNLSHRSGNERYLLGNHLTVAVLGIVIPIVPVVATAALGLLGAAGYLAWRHWRRRSTKSMNFDNPVYRKTTEDEEDEIHIGRTDPYPAVSAGPCQPFIALPLGTGPDAGAHWYSGQPVVPAGK